MDSFWIKELASLELLEHVSVPIHLLCANVALLVPSDPLVVADYFLIDVLQLPVVLFLLVEQLVDDHGGDVHWDLCVLPLFNLGRSVFEEDVDHEVEHEDLDDFVGHAVVVTDASVVADFIFKVIAVVLEQQVHA